MSVSLFNVACLSCNSKDTTPYNERFLCKNCGFTWHKDSKTKDEEMARRAASK